MIAAIAREQTRLLAHAQVIAVRLGSVRVATGIPCGAKRDLDTAANAALLGLYLRHVLQRLDRQVSADIRINPIRRHHGAAQRRVALGGEDDALAR